MKQTKIITHKPKLREVPNIINIKLVTIEGQRTSYKLPKTLRQIKRFLKYLVDIKNVIVLYLVKQ